MSTPTDVPTAGDGGEATRVMAGDCTVVYDGDGREEHRGHVTVIVKPDNTVLVHDADGYQPVAWLTRADAVSCARRSNGPGGPGSAPTAAGTAGGGDSTGSHHQTVAGAAFAVDARDGDARLVVTAHSEEGYGAYPTTRAGRPVGACPDCGETLVRAARTVACIGCGTEHGLPDGATLREERCECGLPRVRVERGEPLDVCLDRQCEPLLAAVRERFDREWSCPDCGSDLRIISRGRLLAGCAAYPDCETAFGVPNGTVVGDCECGLPVFETARGRRCLDTDCEHS